MTRTSTLLVLATALLVRPALAQPGASAELARQLADALTARHAEAWAVADPADPTRFIAALHVPGSQLLVVSTPYNAPESIAYRLAQRDYRQAYVDLQTASVRSGKFFVQDMGADGFDLTGRAHGAVDVVYENGTDRTMLNDDWKAQHLTAAEYEGRKASAEARYVQMLTALLDAVRSAAQAGTPAVTEPHGTPVQH